jgi:hypothetical protein
MGLNTPIFPVHLGSCGGDSFILRNYSYLMLSVVIKAIRLDEFLSCQACVQTVSHATLDNKHR